MNRLPPDTTELMIASTIGSTAACPFCGQFPILTTDQNETTGFHVAKLTCADCFVQMHSCMPTRAAAQNVVIARWAERAEPKI